MSPSMNSAQTRFFKSRKMKRALAAEVPWFQQLFSDWGGPNNGWGILYSGHVSTATCRSRSSSFQKNSAMSFCTAPACKVSRPISLAHRTRP